MKKLLLSFALFFANFVVSADTLTIDGQGIATYTMHLYHVLTKYGVRPKLAVYQ